MTKKLNKNIFKYILSIIGVLIIFLFLKAALIFFDLHPYKLSENYFLIGNGSEDYTISKGFLEKTVVSNMTSRCSWIITQKSIYGSLGTIPSRFFYLDKETSQTNYFVNISKFKKHLQSKGVEKYNISDEENLVHLKYRNGRDRKFK